MALEGRLVPAAGIAKHRQLVNYYKYSYLSFSIVPPCVPPVLFTANLGTAMRKKRAVNPPTAVANNRAEVGADASSRAVLAYYKNHRCDDKPSTRQASEIDPTETHYARFYFSRKGTLRPVEQQLNSLRINCGSLNATGAEDPALPANSMDQFR